jgi:hypothetical protein
MTSPHSGNGSCPRCSASGLYRPSARETETLNLSALGRHVASRSKSPLAWRRTHEPDRPASGRTVPTPSSGPRSTRPPDAKLAPRQLPPSRKAQARQPRRRRAAEVSPPSPKSYVWIRRTGPGPLPGTLSSRCARHLAQQVPPNAPSRLAFDLLGEASAGAPVRAACSTRCWSTPDPGRAALTPCVKGHSRTLAQAILVTFWPGSVLL